ncbi:hypothetical protein BV22DRAFT_1134992 [Leucogyrophana mollusca]|uniref:Uncharacterized protein n=1 Tax=Leucogyrophana mollusca TaxID=85980 RepID=A0ACB8AXC3_9AGAM|nr:hypothetical protein BV22DRAFT_1134992 [Leucogyrophana mollusca]
MFKPHLRSYDEDINALDVKAIAWQDPCIIMSPNMDWVPEAHVSGNEELRACADGQFGDIDCFQWLQLHVLEFQYAICVTRKEAFPHPDEMLWAWWTPTMEDFVAQEGTAFAVVSLSHDIGLLTYYPLTYRDMIVFVAQAQQAFLDIWGHMDFVEIAQHCVVYGSITQSVNMAWMGCFMHDSKVCDEMFAIFPQMNIVKPIILTFPDNIIYAQYSEASKLAKPFALLHRGTGGFLRHYHTRRQYTGLAKSPVFNFTPQTSTASSTAVSKVPASGKAPAQRGGKLNKEKAASKAKHCE